MTTQSGKDPLGQETPPHKHRDDKTTLPNVTTSTSRRDSIARKKKALEERQREFEKKYGSLTSKKLSSSQSTRQDSSKKELGKGPDHGWGEMIGPDQGWGGMKDSPTNSSEGEGGVHWLDALRAEKLSPAEFRDRINKRNAQPDPYIEHLKQINADLEVTMQRHREKAAEIQKKKEELAEWRLTGKRPGRLEEKPQGRRRRPGSRSSSENEYQRVCREEYSRDRERQERGQFIDLDLPRVPIRDREKTKEYGDMEDWWKPTHNGSQDPVTKTTDEAEEPTKLSDLGKSKESEDAADWWKPFQREPRAPLITTLKDPARDKPSVKSVKWGEGLGGGGKPIQPFAGGHLPFHNEPESPLDAAERLEKQLNANDESKSKSKISSARKIQKPLNENAEYNYKHKNSPAQKIQNPLGVNKQEKFKKSLHIPEAIQNPALSYFPNDYAADLSWVQILILVATGMVLAVLGLKIAGVTSERRDVSGSAKWGLGKTVE
ncbi:hypothetical protein EAE96_009443 [Botrytis aclada]|nr:hypothetical protein EAE96_009443 [Botrytis aclada]